CSVNYIRMKRAEFGKTIKTLQNYVGFVSEGPRKIPSGHL
ncbi:MAG: hypothetical protein ACI9QL_002930, partial [Candidatus Omnitrophota bacterium]